MSADEVLTHVAAFPRTVRILPPSDTGSSWGMRMLVAGEASTWWYRKCLLLRGAFRGRTMDGKVALVPSKAHFDPTQPVGRLCLVGAEGLHSALMLGFDAFGLPAPARWRPDVCQLQRRGNAAR